MNILFLINEFGKGGAERVVSHLLTHLPKIYPEINPILFLVEKSVYSYPIPYTIEIYTASKYHSSHILKFLKLPIVALRLKRFIIKNKINVVISFLSRANYTNILARYFGSDHRCIISERNTSSLTYKSKSVTDIINRFLIHKLYPSSQTIIAVSKGVKKDLVEKFNIPDSKISVIYNPYNIQDIKQKSREQLKHKWLGNKEYKIITTVGRLEKSKNHYLLIQACRQVIEKLPETRLIIIGEGSERNKLVQLTSKLGLENKIDFTGEIDNPFPYVAMSDLFVLSSETEGFPNVILEAMICGCPVISTNCQSGPNEIITNSVNGMLVPVGNIDGMSNAIITCLQNDRLRLEFKNNAEKTIQNYEIGKIVKQYGEFLVQTI